MSVLGIGARCNACTVVDFLPFTCPDCSQTFCSAHVQAHDCVSPVAGPSRKRVKTTCALPACEAETIESIGGFEGEEGIARQVRCICGQAYCISHRSQEAHDCPAPRELSARHDAVLARREKAQEVMGRTMPDQAGKERRTMPKQVDRTKRGPVRATPVTSTSEAVELLRSGNVQPSADPPAQQPTTASTADDKIYKVHVMKLKSLAEPIDPKVPRADCCAVELGIDEKREKLDAWLAGGKYAPSIAAAALSEIKPERIWIPLTMPGGKLLDTLRSRSKHPRANDLSLLCIPMRPGPRSSKPIKLAQPISEQIETGDVLLLVNS